jgi:hypothetical protein
MPAKPLQRLAFSRPQKVELGREPATMLSCSPRRCRTYFLPQVHNFLCRKCRGGPGNGTLRCGRFCWGFYDVLEASKELNYSG